ncbi:CysS/YqeB C-terminal domain-containing protein [Geminicoccus harenae]|uniref:CysS/YqeB C-terminal domain-containing protein n=1 Tax=Geminicoccus harenae TaxID=2498453 RepID=UPI003F810CB9
MAQQINCIAHQVLEENNLNRATHAADLLLSCGVNLQIIDHNELFIPNENAKISAMVRVRQVARNMKNYAEADNIREELKQMGVQVEDTKGEPAWKRLWSVRLERS